MAGNSTASVRSSKERHTMKTRNVFKTLFTSLGVTTSVILLSGNAIAEEQQAKPYPMDTCVVSGEKLGEMGDPYVFTYEGQEIKLCCKNCLKKFDKDPQTYLKKLDKKDDAQASAGHEGHNH